MKLKILLNALLFILLLEFNLFAQASSIYSRFGLGNVEYSYSPRRLALGDLGLAIEDRDFLSNLNPAAWNKIGLTRVELGATFAGNFTSSQTQNNYFAGSFFSGFMIGIPISKDYGVGGVVGIVPFSKIGYEVVNTSNSNFSENKKGEGGVSKLFVGTSYRLPFDLSLGASLDYYFGNLNYTSEIFFNDDASTNSKFSNIHRLKGLGFSFGLISPDFSKNIQIKNVDNIKLAFTANLIGNVTGDTTLTKSSGFIIDTVSSGKVKYSIPMRIGFGLGFRLNESYQFALDFITQNWSEYKIADRIQPELQSSSRINFAVEYRPNQFGINFSDLVIYRFGLFYEKTPYYLNNTSINQYGVSAGLSLPMARENTFDIGIQYISRGTTDSQLLKENIIKLGIGVSLGELWFIRQDR